MNLQIEVFRDYIMIGTQRVNRPADIPAHVWMSDWDYMKAALERRVE